MAILILAKTEGTPPVTFGYRRITDANDIRGKGMAFDGSGNMYVSGRISRPNNDNALLVKYTAAGAVDWQKDIGTNSSGIDDFFTRVVVDSSGNIITGGSTESVGAGGRDMILMKFNSAGVVQWQRTLGTTGTEYGVEDIALDDNDDIYITGTQAFPNMIVAKYSSAGVLQWQREVNGGAQEWSTSLTVDSSNNVIVCGYSLSDTEDGLIVKWDSSGVFQWDRRLQETSDQKIYAVTTDSANNILLSCESGFLSTIKLDSSGSIVWQRDLTGVTGGEAGRRIVTDSSNNVYNLGITNAYAPGFAEYDFILAKYNSSGTLQWQRVIRGTGEDRAEDIVFDGAGNIYMVGYTDSVDANEDLIVFKMPESMTIPTTIGAFTAQAGTYTDTTATAWSTVAASFTISTSSLTDTASSIAVANAGLTYDDTNW